MRSAVLMFFLVSQAACGVLPRDLDPFAGSGSRDNSSTTTTGGSSGGSSGTTSGGGSTRGASSGPVTRYVGRFDTTDPNAPVMGWPGSSVLAGFTGSSLTVLLKETAQVTYNSSPADSMYDVYIDDQAPHVITLSYKQTAYPVATNLASGSHTVRLVKRTESQLGVDQFLGFTLASGEAGEPAPAASARHIEFIGDSITAGYGDEANVTAANMCTFTPPSENVEDSYAALTAKALKAEYTDLSFAGKGLYRNRDSVNDPVKTLPYLYNYTYPESDQKWDFSQWTPQVVVINLGTNDFLATASALNVASFQSAYVSFLKVVRGNYPQATLFAVQGPMLSGTQLTQARAAISAAVATRNSSGDSAVHFVELAADTGANGYGCDYHPGTVTHQLMAQALTAAIQAVGVNW